MNERAELAFMVIGPERREKLIARYADGLSLRWGMTSQAARKYATDCFNQLSPEIVLSVGQTWTQRDGKRLEGAEMAEMLGASQVGATSYTVAGFADDMVRVGDGSLLLNYRLFGDMWLTAWPDSFTLDDEPEPPKAALPQPEETDIRPPDGDDEGQRFDPHRLWITATRSSGDGLPLGEGLPLIGEHYRAVNWHKPEYPPFYGNALDVPVYLAEHLADYRAGWPDFAAQYRRGDGVGYFNALDGGCEVDVKVSAYLGHWLWQRVRSDVVTEYGGTVDDYDVMFEWSPGMADLVIEVAPYAHPEWVVPSDHPLAQCDGQTSLLEAS